MAMSVGCETNRGTVSFAVIIAVSVTSTPSPMSVALNNLRCSSVSKLSCECRRRLDGFFLMRDLVPIIFPKLIYREFTQMRVCIVLPNRLEGQKRKPRKLGSKLFWHANCRKAGPNRTCLNYRFSAQFLGGVPHKMDCLGEGPFYCKKISEKKGEFSGKP